MRKLRVRFLVAAVFPLLAAVAAPQETAAPTPPPAADPVLVGAGDISTCANDDDEQTARLLDKIEGAVFTLGDNAYPDGTPAQFQTCYGPTWGRHKARTRPVPGNHDYHTPGAAGYFTYFGAAAGDPSTGYYSYDLGAWHVIVLNSNCRSVGGCGPGSKQDAWLRSDLAAHLALCTVAMWHHPRFSSAEHGDDVTMRYLWTTLYEGGADLVLGGHDHTYERFAPQDSSGKADPARGIREFVVGTGGRSLYKFEKIDAESEVRNNTTYGVLKLTLHPDSYDWEFVPVEGGTFRDSGSGKCH